MAAYLIRRTTEDTETTQIVTAKSVSDAVTQLDLSDGEEVEVFTLRSADPKKYRLRTEQVTRLEAL